MQVGGLMLLLVAGLTSEDIREPGSISGVLVGISALVVAVVSAPPAVHRGHVVPALTLPFSLTLLWLFLHRTLNLDPLTALWALDAALLVLLLVLVRLLLAERDPARGEWVLFATTAGAYAGFVLIFLTSVEAGLEEATAYPLDLWWLVLGGLSWLGWKTRTGGREGWYERQLALLVFIGTALVWFTLGGPLGLDASVYAAVAGFGAAGVLWIGLREASVPLLIAGAACLTVDSWIWAFRAREGWSVVLALVLSAGLLFWAASRIGVMKADPGQAGPPATVDDGPGVR